MTTSTVPHRRQFLSRIGVGLAVPSWAASAGSAEAQALIQVKATATNLTSSNERMVSYRHQQHMVQTPDGALHLLINRGSLTPGPGLSLYSSFDGGSTWSLAQNFSDTDDKSTGDLSLIGDELWMVYNSAAPQVIMFAQLRYDSVLRTWSPLLMQQAFASTQWVALNPALAVDSMGTVWVGFLAKSTRRFNAVGNIRVVNRVGGGTLWTDPNLTFGPTDSNAVERSARPVAIPGGMGMVWTVREVTCWSRRTNALPDNSAWSTATIYTGVPVSSSDPYASHFNVATDDQGGLHLISLENYDILYFSYSASADLWSAPQLVDDGRKVAYAQIGVVNGKLGVAFSVQRGRGGLALGNPLGGSWAIGYDLQLISAYPGVNYNTARVELPTNCTGMLPILQQYADNESQKLMLFKVPAP